MNAWKLNKRLRKFLVLLERLDFGWETRRKTHRIFSQKETFFLNRIIAINKLFLLHMNYFRNLIVARWAKEKGIRFIKPAKRQVTIKEKKSDQNCNKRVFQPCEPLNLDNSTIELWVWAIFLILIFINSEKHFKGNTIALHCWHPIPSTVFRVGLKMIYTNRSVMYKPHSESERTFAFHSSLD